MVMKTFGGISKRCIKAKHMPRVLDKNDNRCYECGCYVQHDEMSFVVEESGLWRMETHILCPECFAVHEMEFNCPAHSETH